MKVSCDSWCSRTLPMNVVIESAHFNYEESIVKYGQR